jgi:predicted metal-dependent enzyme (double-stranded beta helix superfamily)
MTVPATKPAAEPAKPDCIQRLVARLDLAVAAKNEHAVCSAVKAALCEAIGGGAFELPASFVEPVPGGYARRLVHRDPQLRYTVVAMVWGPGQGTPIHDHGDKWCVECVYQGRIRVVSYDVVGEPAAGRVRFRQESEIVAGVGEAGSLIPPFDYHIIENPGGPAAVTLHVYGGEMDGCHSFLPEGGDVYRREWKALRYT